MKIRNVFSMFMLAVAMLFVVGCGDNSPTAVVEKQEADTPTAVVEKWAEALLDGDVEEACEYCTGAPDKEIKAFMYLIALGIEEDEDVREEFEELIKEIDDCEESIDGDRAEVAPEGEEDDPIILKKVDGEWKIDLSEIEK